jgi:hypothetical protein
MGIACRIGGGGGLPPFQVPPVSPVGVHWMLVWRLALSGVTGPASASIHLGTQGAASPILSTLCTTCQAVATGHMTLTADQAQLLLKGDGYINVQAASGELNGQIVIVNHFFFSAPEFAGQAARTRQPTQRRGGPVLRSAEMWPGGACVQGRQMGAP